MNNRERLIDLMSEHNLDRLKIADMIKVKRDTIDHWLLPHESHHHEEVPDMALELLEMKLQFGELPKEQKT
ncbi:MAG: hypothetical protein A3J35_00460 [Gammaproteobacteria bacterium RIFCSPLOWO2_02_FULL_52_10]|nr:MAG: hypothetical protein A3J35_00460 [Gammaproteobacteria bacterium RIFCSPLOWO2_02_FULL_52_10]OGT83561.1 MAG: hypothetical protein A3G96_01615 [Gammaproteobacteria bacterium RIFCSPLOWO2_12_FULL_52_10]